MLMILCLIILLYLLLLVAMKLKYVKLVKKKSFKSKSFVWSHFTKIKENGVEKRAKCNYCNTSYSCVTTNGTSSLWKYLERCPKNLENKERKRQKLLVMNPSTSGQGGEARE